jgi:3-oxoacyl-[acyl-carrier protein] reductase
MRNYLLVGASSGIGRALAEKLSAEGHKLFVITQHPQELQHLENIHFIESGFLNENWTGEGIPESLDGLAYMPGTINLKPVRGLKMSDFRNDFEVNVVGAVKVLQACLKALKNGKAASVILFSTVAVGQGMPFHASIAAAKGAVEGLGRSLAAELAPAIRVNVIAPSLTNTPLAAKLLSTPEKIEASAKRHPLQRVGEATDIANLAAFLLGTESSWITGQVIGVDGGMSAVRS